jgi:hypothetical protein
MFAIRTKGTPLKLPALIKAADKVHVDHYGLVAPSESEPCERRILTSGEPKGRFDLL